MLQRCEDRSIYQAEVHGCRYVMIASAILASAMPETDPDSSKIMPIGTFEITLDGQNDKYALHKLFRMAYSDGIFASEGQSLDCAAGSIRDLVTALSSNRYSIRAIRGVVRKYDIPSGLFADGMVVDHPTAGSTDDDNFILVSQLDWDA